MGLKQTNDCNLRRILTCAESATLQEFRANKVVCFLSSFITVAESHGQVESRISVLISYFILVRDFSLFYFIF